MHPPRHTVLVIDPDPAIRTLILALARREGLDADGVSDSEEALLQARCRQYSAIVLEPRMPGGDALLRELSADGNGTRPKVIVATTPRAFGAEKRWPEAEIVVMKPFDIEELMLAMMACCAESVA